MTPTPTLLFCVGATKASTTWLYRSLSRHPACFVRSIKELHYFDRAVPARSKPSIAKLQRDIARMQAEFDLVPNHGLAQKIRDAKDWLSVCHAPSDAAYLAYLSNGAGDHRVLADVTPAYSLMPVDVLRRMASLLPDVRFVYLLRDPVARLWSHVRMSAFRNGGDLAAEAGRVFDAVLAGNQADVSLRGDYRGAIARLDAAVDPSRLLVMFQEVLLTLPGVTKLCEFVGIADHPADFQSHVHLGPNLTMTEDQLARARVALRPQYEFAASRFGTLPAAWMRNMGEGVA